MICDHIFMNVCFVFISTLIPDATLNSRSRDYGTVGRGGGGCVRMYVCECMCVYIDWHTALHCLLHVCHASYWGGPSLGWAAPSLGCSWPFTGVGGPLRRLMTTRSNSGSGQPWITSSSEPQCHLYI